MTEYKDNKVFQLLEKGALIHSPDSVSIADDVDINRISGNGVVIHGGCRLRGASTSICRGAVIGDEGPVTIENCQIGPGVNLKGGYFKESVFLKNAAMGSGAHVREGTILEEWASGAHSVGFKQTILFPYVTVGSLVNFCDCLMAGGTGKKNHSEVGSSYIHFNFTPNQDKAAASLIGDVPFGVFLDQPPIFLGGQGGLVGPSRLAFGTVIAAGSIYRKDELRPGRLISAGEGRPVNIPYSTGIYRNIKRIVKNNILYVANLLALQQWYQYAREEFVSEEFPQLLLDGLREKVSMGIHERLKRLREFSEKLPESADKYSEQMQEKASSKLLFQLSEFQEKWLEIEYALAGGAGEGDFLRYRELFLSKLAAQINDYGQDYLTVIKSLQSDVVSQGGLWLQGIVDEVSRRSFEMLPNCGLI